MGFGLGFCCHCEGPVISTSNVDSCSFCDVAYRRYSFEFSLSCILGDCTCCNAHVNQTYILEYVSDCIWETAEQEQSYKSISGVITCQDPIVGDTRGTVARLQLQRTSSTTWILRWRYRIAMGGGSPETTTQTRQASWTIATDEDDCLTYNSTSFISDAYLSGASGTTWNPLYGAEPCQGSQPNASPSKWASVSFTMTSAA